MKRYILLFPVGILGTLAACSPGIARAPAQQIPVAVRPPCNAEFTGTGARPVSRTTVANWYIKNGELIYLVFLRGDPEWYDKKTDWKFGADSTGRYVQNFNVGGFRYDIILDRNSRWLSLLDARMDVHVANVGMIDKNGAKTSLRGSEMLAFCWTSPPDAVAEVLARSPASLKFVSSVPDA